MVFKQCFLSEHCLYGAVSFHKGTRPGIPQKTVAFWGLRLFFPHGMASVKGRCETHHLEGPLLDYPLGLPSSKKACSCTTHLLYHCPCTEEGRHEFQIRNGNSAQRGSFWPDIPADIRPKTSVRPPKSWKRQAFWDGQPARTSMEKLRSEKLRADISFPKDSVPRKAGMSSRIALLSSLMLCFATVKQRSATWSAPRRPG